MQILKPALERDSEISFIFELSLRSPERLTYKTGMDSQVQVQEAPEVW